MTKRGCEGEHAKLAVTIVGAGIIGMSIALHLAQQKANVTIIDSLGEIPPCTDGAFAMLIATQPDVSEEFNGLYGKAVAEWRKFDESFEGGLGVRWEGAAIWTHEVAAADNLAAQYERLATWGSDVFPLNESNFGTACPGVNSGPVAGGYFSIEYGVVDPARVWHAMRNRCVDLGVSILPMAPLEALNATDGRVHVDNIPCFDVLVLAAGEGTSALVASLGVDVPYTIASGSLAHSRPVPLLSLPAIIGPGVSVKQNADGRVVAGLHYAPGASCEDISDSYGRELLQAAQSRVEGLPPLELERVTHGRVPIPVDLQPIVGFLENYPNCYVAVMMSGITMAPIMGRLIAEELITGKRNPLLDSYQPGRFVQDESGN